MYMFIIGTRAEAIKLAPLIKECERQDISNFIIATGQHDITETLNMFDIDAIHKVEYINPPVNEGSRYNGNTIKAILDIIKLPFQIRDILSIHNKMAEMIKAKPIQYVIYHGDTMATLAAAVAANIFTLRPSWKSIHVESGLRSGDIHEPFPEEICRRIVDRITNYNLCPTGLAYDNLGRPRNAVVTGNTIVDSVEHMLSKYEIHRWPKEYILVSIHRHENIKNKERLEKIVNSIISIADIMTVIWPLHENTKAMLIKYDLWKKIEDTAGIIIDQPYPYPKMIGAIMDSIAVFGDGGSISEECYLLGTPCFIFRKATERQDLLNEFNQFLINSLDINQQVNKKESYIDLDTLGTPGVSKRIISFLKWLSNNGYRKI